MIVQDAEGCPVGSVAVVDEGAWDVRTGAAVDSTGDPREQAVGSVVEVDVDRPVYSFVIPVYREEGSLMALAERLRWLMGELDGPAEVILVDDGSDDSSFVVAQGISRDDGRFKVVSLSRNFGHQVALTAGLDLAEGDAVITMDADLQHPVEVVPEMVQRWREGFDVVYGVMRSRPSESLRKRKTSDWFYKLLSRLVDVHMPNNAGDFRLIDRNVLLAVRSMPERNRYLRGMFAWVGFKQVGVEYDCLPRFAGRSTYTWRKMLNLGFNAVVGFSLLPLRCGLVVGMVTSLLALALGVVTLVTRLLDLYTVPGWTTVVVATTFIGGVQLLVVGLVGEYVGRIYDEVKQRPLYLIGQTAGFPIRRGADTRVGRIEVASHAASTTAGVVAAQERASATT